MGVLSISVMMNNAWSSVSEQIFPSFKNLLWSCVQYFMKDCFRLEIGQHDIPYEIYSISLPKLGNGFMIQTIDEAIQFEKEDKNRVHELLQLRRMVSRKFSGYQIACLARVNIIDITKPPSKRIKTDIDSFVISISNNSVILELNESKNMKGNKESAAIIDLRKNLASVLSSTAKGYRIRRVEGMGAKLVIKCNSN